VGVVVVVTGGDAPQVLPPLPTTAWVIGVDSGVGHALRLGLTVHEAIGDFDSIAPGHLARVSEAGAVIERHEIEKDATDLELALEAATRRAPSQIVLLGGHGGRADHAMANLLLLASPRFAPYSITAHMGESCVRVIRGHARIPGTAGELISLLPVHGDAVEVTTSGLRYPLHGETLTAGSTRGVSNEFVDPIAKVSVRRGVLLAICPRHYLAIEPAQEW
jgi:thiamine pyrophosphokinase